jgi:hypothetical protein
MVGRYSINNSKSRLGTKVVPRSMQFKRNWPLATHAFLKPFVILSKSDLESIAWSKLVKKNVSTNLGLIIKKSEVRFTDFILKLIQNLDLKVSNIAWKAHRNTNSME